MQPFLGVEEIAAVSEVIASGWVAQGPKVGRVRNRVCRGYANRTCRRCIQLRHGPALGTGGRWVFRRRRRCGAVLLLHRHRQLGVYVGTRPVFDVDPLTGDVTAATITAALTPATKAVIVVVGRRTGRPRSRSAPSAILGIVVRTVNRFPGCSTYKGGPVGAGAGIAAWSFPSRKIITTGEGRMISTCRAIRPIGPPFCATRDQCLSSRQARSMLAPPEQYLEVGFNFA